VRYDFYNGEVLLVDKPLTWSSFQAVNKIKHAMKQHPSLLVDGQRVRARIGHAGTLDPLATGLLILCTGKKTKSIASYMGLEKEYTGTFLLGATTPCYDLEKPVDRTFPVSHITEDEIYACARSMTGEQMQTPPAFSAVLIGGTRSYELARKGEEVELAARAIEIKAFEITSVRFPEVDFRIVCSKGTYIRSIARDFGTALKSGAHLTALRRTRIGEFSVTSAVAPEVLAERIREDQMLR
jgi:tRNA pseudouridine55 synthase